MAKKTKKEKIMAQYHLSKKAFAGNNTVTTPQDDYGYVIKDLGRIGLLTALAICAQFVLWYYLGK